MNKQLAVTALVVTNKKGKRRIIATWICREFAVAKAKELNSGELTRIQGKFYSLKEGSTVSLITMLEDPTGGELIE